MPEQEPKPQFESPEKDKNGSDNQNEGVTKKGMGGDKDGGLRTGEQIKKDWEEERKKDTERWREQI